MNKFNLGTRIELFAICSSIEIDIKKFILSSQSEIAFESEMLEKAQSRKNGVDIKNASDVLDQLDLKDYVSLIAKKPYEYGLNVEKVDKLEAFFNKIIPVRNRVMHTKPIELGDRALLIEVMDKIDGEIPWIDWTEVVSTRKKLETDPSQLLLNKFIPKKEYNSKVYNNLPEPEFDDTGYIGRQRERKEIRDLLRNGKNQIITIVGNGGVGKTAVALKTLYDLMDEEDCPFECIIWVTLKTKTLSNGEFVEIKESIKSIPEIYSYSQSQIITDDTIPSKNMLLKFMDDFKALLVLDNLETVNTEEISEFIKDVPEKSKVLITSRYGLGEFEIRKKLGGLEKQDAVKYFRELSRYYGLDLYKRSDNDILAITDKALYSNPLSIKWYISGVFNGMDEKTLLSNKTDLINFCMSNVFERIQENSKSILQLFLLEKQKMSYGTIDFYMDAEESELISAINELLSTYMISPVSGEYVMNAMAREYLSINYPPSNQFITKIFNKRKLLKQCIQSVKVDSEQAPFNPQSINVQIKTMDMQLATFYLQTALRYSKEKQWDKSIVFCDKARIIEPNYFETYKVRAFIDAERGEFYGAINNYEIAIKKCETNYERAIVHYLFAIFYLIKMQELDLALENIESADAFCPDTSEILLEKARVYMYMGKYDDAERILNRVSEKEINPVLRTQNILASRYAELYRRKAETYQNRDNKMKIFYLQKAIEQFNSVESLDIKSGLTLLDVLTDTAYIFFSDEAMSLIADTVQRYSDLLFRIKGNKKDKLREQLRDHKAEIKPEIYCKIERFVENYQFTANEINSETEGIVTSVRDYYGFIANHIYCNTNAIYFSISNAYSGIQIGDHVSFELYDGRKGKAAKNVKKLK